MTPDLVLGPALLEAVRQVVRDELQGRPVAPVAPEPELLTPREASERLGGRPSPKTIVEWIHTGRLPVRTNNMSPDPKRPNFLVVVDEVRAAVERRPAAPSPPAELAAARARARELVAKVGQRGTGRGGR